MLPKTHFWTTLILSITAWVFNITTPLQSAAILFGGFLIDTDHYLLHVFKNKNWSLRKAYKWYYGMYLRREKRVLMQVFHTVESFILVFILGYLHPIFFYVFAGMVFHIILDIIQAVQHKHYAKDVSIIYSLIKNGLK